MRASFFICVPLAKPIDYRAEQDLLMVWIFPPLLQDGFHDVIRHRFGFSDFLLR